MAPGAEAEWQCWAGLFHVNCWAELLWATIRLLTFLKRCERLLMLINGEFGTFALVSEGFDFLINNGFIAVGLMLCILRFL